MLWQAPKGVLSSKPPPQNVTKVIDFRRARLTAALLAARYLAEAAPTCAQNRVDQIRLDIAARGLTAAMVYDGDAFANLAGGQRRGAIYLGNLQLQLFVDGERLMGWRGATLSLTGLWTHGSRPSQLSGDAQGVSNIEAPPEVQLYEAWLQQNLLFNHLSLLAGLYDLNSEFYTLQSAALFLNSSFGSVPSLRRLGSRDHRSFRERRSGLALQ